VWIAGRFRGVEDVVKITLRSFSMQANDRLQRVLRVRQLGGATAIVAEEHSSKLQSDVKLFAMTFAGGFLFTTIFLG
jgi:hypothetical protein